MGILKFLQIYSYKIMLLEPWFTYVYLITFCQGWVFNYTNTNRIRLGDIIALIDVYFECAWRANVEAAWENVLDAERLSKFQMLGSWVELGISWCLGGLLKIYSPWSKHSTWKRMVGRLNFLLGTPVLRGYVSFRGDVEAVSYYSKCRSLGIWTRMTLCSLFI